MIISRKISPEKSLINLLPLSYQTSHAHNLPEGLPLPNMAGVVGATEELLKKGNKGAGCENTASSMVPW